MITVTGGLGFIGSCLVKRLIGNGIDVAIIDDYSTGLKENLGPARDDITMIAPHVNDIPKNTKLIYHLGMPSSSPMYKRDRTLVTKVVEDATAVLEFCKEHKIPLVYASTSSLYNGNPTPWREDMPIHVTDFYTEARYYLERMAELYHKLYGNLSVGLRFFSVYGPGEMTKGQYANLISQFMWDIHADRNPIIYGDGTQARDFTYVDDVVDALTRAGGYVRYGGCDIFNVGTGVSTALNDVVGMLNKMIRKDIIPQYIENKISNYVPTTLANCIKSQALLEWQAKTPLYNGIYHTYELYKKQH